MAHLLKSNRFITVGKNSFYNGKMFRKGFGHTKIGSFCAIGENLNLIAGNNHGVEYPAVQVAFYRKHFPGNKYPGFKEPLGITIGSDVWIGDNVTILDGAQIGDGCVVAAGAVLSRKKHAPFSIIGGVPAKFIKFRFPEYVRDYLNMIKWWEKSHDWIEINKEFFFSDLANISYSDFKKLIDKKYFYQVNSWK